MIGTFKATLRPRGRVVKSRSCNLGSLFLHFWISMHFLVIREPKRLHILRGLPVHRNSVSSRLVGGFELS